MTRQILFLLIFNALSHASEAQEYRRWSLNLHGGYQYASPQQSLGRFTDALRGSPHSGAMFGLDLAFFWNKNWGAFAAVRYSESQRNWPGTLQRAVERDYPGELVRVAFTGGAWDGSVSQGLLGVRRRFYFPKINVQPSLAAGFIEVQVADAGADLKTPGSHALRNVFAFNGEEGPWLSSLALDAGVRLEWSPAKQLGFSASAHYTWTKPELVFEFYEVDQVASTLRSEELRYERAQHLVLLMAGLTLRFGKKR